MNKTSSVNSICTIYNHSGNQTDIVFIQPYDNYMQYTSVATGMKQCSYKLTIKIYVLQLLSQVIDRCSNRTETVFIQLRNSFCNYYSMCMIIVATKKKHHFQTKLCNTETIL